MIPLSSSVPLSGFLFIPLETKNEHSTSRTEIRTRGEMDVGEVFADERLEDFPPVGYRGGKVVICTSVAIHQSVVATCYR